MKYALKNLLALMKTEKFIFSVMLISVFISAWAMTFSYGLYHHYSALSAQEEGKGMYVTPEIAEGKTLTRGDVVRYLYAISPKTHNAMNIIVVNHTIMGGIDDNGEEYALGNMVSRVVVRNGEIIPAPYIVSGWDELNMIASGRYISEAEESSGAAVVIAEEKIVSSENPHEALTFPDDETLIIDDVGRIYEYKIVGTHTSQGVVVPLLSMPEDTDIGYISLSFEKQVTNKQFKELIAAADEAVPGVLIFPEQELPDAEAIHIYNNMMIVSALIAALTVINFAFLYSFILGKRTRTLAIMRICGCTEGRAWGICLGECCLICIPTFIVGVLTYIPFMKNVLSEPFEFIEEAYSLPVYAILFAIYAVMLFVIMGIMLKKQTSRELAEGRKGGAI